MTVIPWQAMAVDPEQTQLDVFHFDQERDNFEAFSRANGQTFWYASDLMRMLGYLALPSFRNAINRAMTACAALNISVSENFREEKREVDGKVQLDWKLSRFACYLAAMNGDTKKPQVAAAQAYFATMAEGLRRYIQSAEDVERVAIRDDISEREKTLSGVAKSAGVTVYPYFQNAGYRGMYNCNINDLRSIKGIPASRSPLDFMGKQELAANLFRITQTEAKIVNNNVRGQKNCESAASQVGQAVRQTMINTSGTRPESLAPADDIRQLQKGLKDAHREFKQIDKPKD